MLAHILSSVCSVDKQKERNVKEVGFPRRIGELDQLSWNRKRKLELNGQPNTEPEVESAVNLDEIL